MIVPFGLQAARYARGLGDLDAIVAEVDEIGAAYMEAVRWRTAGRPFYIMLLMDDPRIAFGYHHSEAILAPIADYDVRRLMSDQLALGALPVNGKRIDTLWSLDPVVENIVLEFLSLADSLLVRSYAEIERINDAFSRGFPRRTVPPIVRILAESTVPIIERERPERPGVVVWAPHRRALDTTLHMHGLAEFHGELTCVSAGGPLPSRSPATFLAPDDPGVAPALARAAAVVCIDPSDPSDAVAFARQGYGIVAPLSCGAHEFASDVLTLDALNARFLHTAVAVAMTRPANARSAPPRPPRAPQLPSWPAFIKTDALPLVSIVTPTYNRPDDLRKMLLCLAAQTYPNIEAVVVNDGGSPVGEIVAAFPFARLIDLTANAGALRAVERGRHEARGEYIGLLPDDDWLYPDHIERLVNAMLRSGAKIAHGSGILRYLDRDAAGDWQTIGFNNRTFAQTHSPSDALVISNIGNHQMLAHRSVYDAIGGFLLDTGVADNEIHMRISEHYFYAYAAHVTAEFRDHASGENRRHDFAAELRAVYDNVHPVPDRIAIKRLRDATVANIAARPAGQPPFPQTIRMAQPEKLL